MKNKITRESIEKLLNTKDWGKKGSEEREVALILVCSGIVGAFPKKIEEILGSPKKILNKTARLARENQIWTKDGEVDCEWSDKKTGTIALACDVVVCMGLIKRTRKTTKKLK